MWIPNIVENIISDAIDFYDFAINKNSDVKELTDQIIEYQSDKSPLREERINILIQKVIQGNNPRCKQDDVIHLRTIIHFLDEEQALRLNGKLKNISQDLSCYTEQEWDACWKQYDEYIDLLHPDIVLSQRINEQLFSLDHQSRQLLKEIISEAPQGERRYLFDLCFKTFFDPRIDEKKFEVTKQAMGTPDEQKLEILHYIKMIPVDDRVDVINHVTSFGIEKMNWHRRGVILAIIGNISKDDRESLIKDAKDFFTDSMDGFCKIEILKSFQKITKEERDDVINHAIAVGIDEAQSAEDRAGIVITLVETAKEDRIDIVEQAKCFIEVVKVINTTDGDMIEIICMTSRTFKTQLLHTIKRIAKEERSEVIKDTKLLLRNQMSRIDTVRVLAAVGKVPKEDRSEITKHIKFLNIGEIGELEESDMNRFFAIAAFKGNGIAGAIEVFSMVPRDERELLAQSFKPLMATMSKLCLTDTGRALFFFYLLPSDLKTETKLQSLQSRLLANTEYREAVEAVLERKLADHTIDLSKLADLVYKNIPLHSEHPLLQRVIEIISANSVKGEKNPFAIYRKLKELKSLPSAFEPKSQTLGDSTVAISMKRLSEVSSKIEVRRQHLSSEVTLQAWNRLREDLKAKIESSDHLKTALNAYKTTWDAIWQLSLGDPYLSGLLSLSGEKVSLTEAKFRAVLRNLLAKSTDPRPGSPFTEQEEVLIKTAMMIQQCPGGKQEGIDLIYGQLPSEYQYRVKLPVSSQEEDKQDRIRRFVEEVVKKFISFQFWGDNLPIMQELTGEKDIKQGSHQSIYVKNMVSHLLGLDHELIFDQSAGVLSDSLIAKSRDEILEIIFTHVTPEKLAQELIRVVNSDLHKNSRIVFPLIEAGEYWNMPDDLSLTLNIKGAIKLLQETEYFT